MSEGLRIPVPKRPRRSHAERTAATRRRVKAAVVESIAAVGYQKTTGAEIARRAGVTWGAVQHHFGDKDGILMAVLEESFNRFAEILGAPPDDASGLTERVSIFVERAWTHFASDHYRTTLEILLNLPSDLDPSWEADLLASWKRIWQVYFPENPMSARQTANLMHYTISVLTGLAAMNMLTRRDIPVGDEQLAMLEQTLVRTFSARSTD